MKTNKTFGVMNGTNRTPFHQTHLAMSGELVNEMNAPICSFEIDDVPDAIRKGNAEMVMGCLNNYDDLIQALKTIAEYPKASNMTGSGDAGHKSMAKIARDAMNKAAL